MKVILAVALFAFVAVQLNHAAPVPEEDKKLEPVAASPATAESAPPAAPAAAAVEAKAAETPAETPAPAPAPTEVAKPAEEKKA